MEDRRSFFSKIFMGMMIFCALVWIWTIALIFAWPWEKNGTWKADFRLPAVCAEQTLCGTAFADLAKGKASGKIVSLNVPDDGEVMEEESWLKWSVRNGVIEARASSWNFQTRVRYRVDAGEPVLVAYQEIGAKTVYYGIGLGLFTLIGLYLRRLRG